MGYLEEGLHWPFSAEDQQKLLPYGRHLDLLEWKKNRVLMDELLFEELQTAQHSLLVIQ